MKCTSEDIPGHRPKKEIIKKWRKEAENTSFNKL